VRTKILYICAPNSIHDIKWMSYFSIQQDKYEVLAIYESSIKLSESDSTTLKSLGIKLMEPIHPFSISSPVKTIQSIFQLRKVIKEYKIDLVHILFATPHALWGNFISVPYIITTRGSDVLIVLPSLSKHKIKFNPYSNFLFYLFKHSFERAKAITSTSIAQIEAIQNLFGISKSKLIRTGVDVDSISKIVDQNLLSRFLANKKFVFFPRNIAPNYNTLLQIDALRYLSKETIDNYYFVFVKSAHFDPNYVGLVAQKLLEAADEVGLKYFLIDYFTQPEMWVHYKFASLVVMTPISDGTPNSALEAMAAGAPLILSNLTYDTELFENVALILDKMEPQNLANLIEIGLSAYPQSLLSTAHKNVCAFGDRKREMSKLEKFYESVFK
jgi:glycosyltransferase involved in cell wall biosynthesis